MAIWSAFIAILTFPGKCAASRFPDLDAEHSRLLDHMVNYIFWLTPTVGIIIWLVIRHAIARAGV